MASPQRSKMSLFPETAFARVNTTRNGRGYQITGDGGWRPLTDHKEAKEQYTGSEAPLSDSISAVTKAWEGSYNRFLRTRGEELWWRHAVGGYNPSPVAEGSLFRKSYFTDRRGVQGSYTIVQDRFALGTVPGIYTSVYRGCKVRSWSMLVVVDQPVQISSEVIASRNVVTSGGQTANLAPYTEAETFLWRDCKVRIGPAGLRGTFDMPFVRMFRIRMNNQLDLSRYYTDGDTNLAEPVPQDTNTGAVDLELDYGAVVDTWFLDNFEEGNQVSVELSAARPGGYKMRLWIPYVFLDNVPVAGGGTDVAKVPVRGVVRYKETHPDHAVQLELVTDGSSI